MFDKLTPGGETGTVTVPALIAALGRRLQPAQDEVGQHTAAELIDLIGALETLKSVASAAQAHFTAEFAAFREAELAPLKARDDDRGAAVRRDIGAQIGLARRVSPRVGARLVGLAEVLTTEMPSTMAALRGGRIDEYQALLVVAETATLSREHRAKVDAELAARLGTLSPGRARSEAARIGYRLDPDQAVRRARKAVGDRCVTLRPAPDTMTYLTALLPAVHGVAAYAALTRHAASATASGDARGRGALMADALVARLVSVPLVGVPSVGVGAVARAGAAMATGSAAVTVSAAATGSAAGIGSAAATGSAAGTGDAARTGRASGAEPLAVPAVLGQDERGADGEPSSAELGTADDTGPAGFLTEGLPDIPAGVQLEIQLLMTDRTLFSDDPEPAILAGFGPVPAPLARHLARGGDPHTTTWVRRLYADATGRIADADSRRRLFSHPARQVLVARDQVCRTPWCGAPIQHADHTQAHARGGVTALGNGAGRCAACNQIKEAPGWSMTTDTEGAITTATPTGHRYRSIPPPAPGSAARHGDGLPSAARTARTA
ncbi:HNH endonuclease [Nakamurella deserti]|uniref:HNH endonuclease n=1 Tax=Nakamurella deserti TaxID=2164074 RepID=UPI000DBE4197|nr:DUF222 domain-containing protein [Nakamurella deserti]